MRPIQYFVDSNDCWNVTSHKPNSHGYPRVYVNKKQICIYRYYYELHKGAIPSDKLVRHTCDNTLCVNPSHLILGDTLDNVRDRVSRDRSAKGTSNGRSKLSEEQVLQIKRNLENKTKTELSKMYDVSRKVIYNIMNELSWRHV